MRDDVVFLPTNCLSGITFNIFFLIFMKTVQFSIMNYGKILIFITGNLVPGHLQSCYKIKDIYVICVRTKGLKGNSTEHPLK